MITNKHLKDQIIQAFLDGELPELKQKAVELHLDSCPKCRNELKIRSEWALRVKESLAENSLNKPELPKFRMDTAMLVQHQKRSLLFPLLKIAAGVIFLLGLTQLFHKEKETTYQPTADDLLLWEETSAGNDANYLWHNRQVLLLSADQNGKLNLMNVD